MRAWEMQAFGAMTRACRSLILALIWAFLVSACAKSSPETGRNYRNDYIPEDTPIDNPPPPDVSQKPPTPSPTATPVPTLPKPTPKPDRPSRPSPTPTPGPNPPPSDAPDALDQRLGPWLDLKAGGIAIGSAQGRDSDVGRLENGTLLPASGPGFKRMSRPDGNWGTGYMISLLKYSAAEFHRRHPEILVHVGGISRQGGGRFPPHMSHQNGLDADVFYMGQTSWKPVVNGGSVTAVFDREKNWEYWRMIVNQRYSENGKVDSIVSLILVDPVIKRHLCSWARASNLLEDPLNREVMRRLRATTGHDDHFHIRLRCSPYHKRCIRTWGPGPNAGMGCD